jgi:hypothetical protein
VIGELLGGWLAQLEPEERQAVAGEHV